MKRKLGVLTLIGVLVFSVAPVWADGDFYVVAGGGQPVGTKITSLPRLIDRPGFYFLTGNLTSTDAHGITITVDDVTIDLMGYCLSNNGTYSGIITSGINNVEIRNGTLSGWWHGIYSVNGNNNRFINIRIKSNGYHGIYVAGNSHLIKGCEISNSGDTALYVNGSGTISNNIINSSNNRGIEIQGYAMISGNLISNAPTHIYLYGFGNIIGNTIKTESLQTGIDISGATPSNPFPILVDQNTVGGAGTPINYTTGSGVVIGKNAGF
jgi:hypothetical protein